MTKITPEFLEKWSADKITVQKVRKARLDPTLMRRLSREGPGSMLDGETRLQLRQLAKETLPLAKRTDPKITLQKWIKRLRSIMQSRRPEVVRSLKKALRARYTKK